jgi:hypothetical protein
MTDTPPPTDPNEANKAAGAGCMARIVRRLLVWIDGSDYRERFLRLSKNYALSDMVGRKGRFRSARGTWHDCVIRGVVVRMYDGDYLMVDYTTKNGEYIEGAEIPRDEFI